MPNTDYQAELIAGKSETQLKFRTRNDKFPVGKKTILPVGESDKTILITESGTPDAYHLVTVSENEKSVFSVSMRSKLKAAFIFGALKKDTNKTIVNRINLFTKQL